VDGPRNTLVNGFHLFQNFPNPFNPSTIISYQLVASSQVTLKVYDVLGNEVTTLINEEKQAGNYEIEFNASSLPDGKAGLSSGIYFYKLQTEKYTETRKMILLR
jgi:hypothetical protein